MDIESQLGSLCRRETGDKQVNQTISGSEQGLQLSSWLRGADCGAKTCGTRRDKQGKTGREGQSQSQEIARAKAPRQDVPGGFWQQLCCSSLRGSFHSK